MNGTTHIVSVVFASLSAALCCAVGLVAFAMAAKSLTHVLGGGPPIEHYEPATQ